MQWLSRGTPRIRGRSKVRWRGREPRSALVSWAHKSHFSWLRGFCSTRSGLWCAWSCLCLLLTRPIQCYWTLKVLRHPPSRSAPSLRATCWRALILLICSAWHNRPWGMHVSLCSLAFGWLAVCPKRWLFFHAIVPPWELEVTANRSLHLPRCRWRRRRLSAAPSRLLLLCFHIDSHSHVSSQRSGQGAHPAGRRGVAKTNLSRWEEQASCGWWRRRAARLSRRATVGDKCCPVAACDLYKTMGRAFKLSAITQSAYSHTSSRRPRFCHWNAEIVRYGTLIEY